ncbi:MAG: hypothetical protein ACLRWQ_05545 [Flavonifractor plautii]
MRTVHSDDNAATFFTPRRHRGWGRLYGGLHWQACGLQHRPGRLPAGL